jgi:hypothetical protein
VFCLNISINCAENKTLHIFCSTLLLQSLIKFQKNVPLLNALVLNPVAYFDDGSEFAASGGVG